MAIGTPTSLLSAGSGTSATSYNTASVSPAANVTLVLFVSAGITAAAAAPNSVSGLGLTWAKRTDVSTGNGNLNGSTWVAKAGASPGSGAITIGFAAAPTNVGWRLTSVPGANPSTNVNAAASTSLTPSTTVPNSVASTSAMISYINYNAGTANTMTQDTGYTKIGFDLDTPGNPANQVSAAYDITSPTTSVTWSTTNASGKTVHAVVLTEDTGSSGGTAESLLSAGSGTSGTTYTTASVTPPANAALMLWVGTGLSAAATPPTNVTGMGLTWTKVQDTNTANNNVNGALYTARTGSSPSSGAITITYSASRDNVGWKLVALPGFYPTSNAAIVSSSVNAPSTTLPSAPASTSAVFAFLLYNANITNTITAATNFTKVGGDLDTPGGTSMQLSAAWNDPPSPGTTVAYTTSNASNKVLVGIEMSTTPSSNTAPNANAGLDQTVDALTTVTLSGSGSSDPDGSISSYNWTQVAGSTVTLSGTGASRTFVAPASIDGTSLMFSLTVTDNNGLTSSADAVVITVNPHNRFRVASDNSRRGIRRSRK